MVHLTPAALLAILKAAGSTVADVVWQATSGSESLILFLLGAVMIGTAGVLGMRHPKRMEEGTAEPARVAQEGPAQQSAAQATRAEAA
jgi:Na+/H+-translocating membrane pyrophosphatase